MSGPRIAIYSQDGLGLGHLRRNSRIGYHLLDASRESSVLLIADSPVAPFFNLPPGMDHLKLPSIRKIQPGDWKATHLPLPTPELLAMRSGLLREVFLDYQPDIVLVDHMPHGALGELIKPLEALKQARPSCRVVLGLRDILDSEEVIRQVWLADGAYDALLHFYDCILIYGSDEIFDTVLTYHLPLPAHCIHYCGYVATAPPSELARQVRQGVHPVNQPFVFVSTGGGADGDLVVRTYLGAIRLLDGQVGFESLIAVGVNAPTSTRRELEDLAEGLPVQMVPYVDDSMSYVAAADLVVCMAGYNTLAEVLHLRRKALVVPRRGPSAEQKMRAGLFAGRGLIDVLMPEDLTPARLAERVLIDLARADLPAADAMIDTDGGRRAASRLLSLVAEQVHGVA